MLLITYEVKLVTYSLIWFDYFGRPEVSFFISMYHHSWCADNDWMIFNPTWCLQALFLKSRQQKQLIHNLSSKKNKISKPQCGQSCTWIFITWILKLFIPSASDYQIASLKNYEKNTTTYLPVEMKSEGHSNFKYDKKKCLTPLFKAWNGKEEY